MIQYLLVMKMYSKKIKLNKTVNTRTLSNLKNKNGKSIKQNLLLRSDALTDLDLADQIKLQEEFQLRRVIDLRTLFEIEHKPDVAMDGVRYFSNPIIESEKIGMTKKGDAVQDFNDFIMELNHNGVESSERFMINTYDSIIKSDYANKGYQNFLKILLEPTGGSTLWHCSAGKDRAGFATILVLYLLDFSWEDIEEDYLATNLFYQDKVKELEAVYGSEFTPILWSVFGVKISYLEQIMSTINNIYGSFDRYIEDALLFSKEDKKKLQKIYLGE